MKPPFFRRRECVRRCATNTGDSVLYMLIQRKETLQEMDVLLNAHNVEKDDQQNDYKNHKETDDFERYPWNGRKRVLSFPTLPLCLVKQGLAVFRRKAVNAHHEIRLALHGLNGKGVYKVIVVG